MKGLVFALGMLFATLGGLSLWAPLHLLDSSTRIEIAPKDVTAERGFTFLTRAPAGEASDLDNRSRLRLLEDGLDLEPHAERNEIRRRGDGRFTHWGDYILFAATDNSNPRTNGRSYEILRPTRRLGARHRTAALTFLVAGALLAVLGSFRGSGPRRAAAAACLVTVVVAVATNRSDAWTARLDAWQEPGATTQRSPPSSKGAPRTQRLGDARNNDSFEASAVPSAVRPPLELKLSTEAGSPATGILELTTEDPLTATLQEVLPANDVEEIRLRVRVESGDQLGLALHLGLEGEHEMLQVPVEPSGMWSTIRITQPLLMTRFSDLPLTRIQVGNPGNDGELLRLELQPIIVKRSGDRFASATHGWDRVAIHGSLRPALWQSVPGNTMLPLDGDVAGRLRGAVATFAGGARIRVLIDDDVALEREVLPEEGWIDFDVPLPAGDALTLTVAELDPGATVLWSGLRRIDSRYHPRRVVLIVMDTLRADALSCYGGNRAHTPALDALASGGLRFERCYSQSHWTRPSMASIMSGRYVTATGVQTPAARLPESYGTLAEALADAGFHTVALLTNTNAGPAAGLGQGFDEVVMKHTQVARELFTEIVLPRTRALAADDLFVYVHLMDTHGAYGPSIRPTGWVAPRGTPVKRVSKFDRRWVESPSTESRVALYHMDVERMDEAIGEFLATLISEWEVDGAPPVVIAAMSDHGEMLGEAGRWGHLRFLHVPELTHVPLIIRAPGQLPAGSAWPHPVESRGVGATLLDLVGARPPPEFGASLLGRVLRQPAFDGPHLALSSDERYQDLLFSVYGPDGGLIGSGGELVERTDARHRWKGVRAAASLQELAARTDGAFEQVWREYLARHEAERDRLWAQASTETMSIDAAQLEQLRELGYMNR